MWNAFLSDLFFLILNFHIFFTMFILGLFHFSSWGFLYEFCVPLIELLTNMQTMNEE
jgi:hypothetical protein